MARFLDFRELREQLDFAHVLNHYGVVGSVREQQLVAMCPLPTHSGVRVKPTFSADLTRGIWRCFSCKSSGNVIDFAVRMEGHELRDGAAVREVALKLRRRFLEEPVSPSPPEEATRGAVATAVINAPLGFTLKGLDSSHESLAELGLRADTIAHFGLGYCSRGFLRGRIAVPLHDTLGELIGYAGRRISRSTREPLYLFPSERQYQGVSYRFALDRYLYGAHLVNPESPDALIVGDDLGLVWHLWERGMPAVAVASDMVSPEQWEIITRLSAGRAPILASRSFHDSLTT